MPFNSDKKIKYQRLTTAQLNTILHRIDQNKKQLKTYNKDKNEAKTLIILTHTLKTNAKTLINLKSNHFERKKNNTLQIYLNGKKQKITLNNPYHKKAWEYIKTIPPNKYIFPTFRSQRTYKSNNKTYTNNTDKYYYYIKKWSLSLNQHRTPSTFK